MDCRKCRSKNCGKSNAGNTVVIANVTKWSTSRDISGNEEAVMRWKRIRGENATSSCDSEETGRGSLERYKQFCKIDDQGKQARPESYLYLFAAELPHRMVPDDRQIPSRTAYTYVMRRKSLHPTCLCKLMRLKRLWLP